MAKKGMLLGIIWFAFPNFSGFRDTIRNMRRKLRHKLKATIGTVALLSGSQAFAQNATTADLVSVDTYAEMIDGTCTNGPFPMFEGSAKADAQLNDTTLFRDYARIVAFVIDPETEQSILKTVRESFIQMGAGRNAIEVVKAQVRLYGDEAVTRSLIACDSPGKKFTAVSDPNLRYVYLDQKGPAELKDFAGIPVDDFKNLTRNHEFGHVYTNNDALADIINHSGLQANQASEAIADAYMILATKQRGEASDLSINQFLAARDRRATTDILHDTRDFMSPALRDQLLATASNLKGKFISDRDLFALTADLFVAALRSPVTDLAAERPQAPDKKKAGLAARP